MKQFEQQSEKKEQSILKDEYVKYFIETRNIRPKDFELIEKLYNYPQEFFIEYHNFYNLAVRIIIPFKFQGSASPACR